ncbi:unnamed protein product [Phytophthora fragariaefolia]|uniref:Unnamed protein product n=1 Tax=Phytophthora fragariaefolia TaxID=1490495 RepID=A0A9W6Y2V0_9STRA|nr:unnamed protein product [Phytophthora fragariaefolia]
MFFRSFLILSPIAQATFNQARRASKNAEDMYSEVATPKSAAPTTFDKANKEAERSIKPNCIVYTSVLVALLQPFQSGWSTSQTNLTQYNDTDQCNARPPVEGTVCTLPYRCALEAQ